MFERAGTIPPVSELGTGPVRTSTEEALASLRAEYGQMIQQLQAEIRAVGATVERHRRHIEHLEGALASLSSAVDGAVVARREAEEELARMRATLTWRLRGRLLRVRVARSAVRLARQVTGTALRISL